MATSITTNVDDAEEAVLIRLTDEFNQTGGGVPNDPLSPAQFFRRHARDWLRSQAQRFFEKDQTSMRSAYKAAPGDVQVQVDALLAPFR